METTKDQPAEDYARQRLDESPLKKLWQDLKVKEQEKPKCQ